MRILHVPFGYYPDSVGGTEVYVRMLGRCLHTLGVEIVIAAPAEINSAYIYDDLPVRRYGLAPDMADLSAIYGTGDPVAAQNFARILDKEKPDVIHLHAFTSGVSLLLAHEARLRNLPIIFTYHTPVVSCARGTLLRWGTDQCNGQLDTRLCTRCALHGLGVNRPTSTLLSFIPPSLNETFAGQRGGLWTGLRMSGLVKLRHETIMALMHEVDKIVVLCNWTRELLLINNVPAEKIIVSQHGLADIESFAGKKTDFESSIAYGSAPLRLIYLGRIDPVKGLDTLIRAMLTTNSASIKLDIYGTLQPGYQPYLERLKSLVAGDPRIRFMQPVAREQLIQTLSQYDFLVVPSQWLETGPLVVLEAFAAGTPVIGSRLGGIAELVEHNVNGLLVEPTSVPHWRETLHCLLQQPQLRTRLQEGIKPPKRMSTVAYEMLELYKAVLQAA